MRRIFAKGYDIFLGVMLSFGLAMAIWLLLKYFFEGIPDINGKNTLFLFISTLVPWVFNFIFEYSSSLPMKGVLHGGLWFMLDIIVFNFIYGVALEAQVLLILIFASVILYGTGLYLFSRVSAKLNMPIRCISAFSGKICSRIQKNQL